MPLYVNPLAESPVLSPDIESLRQRKERVAFKELEQLFASMLVSEMRKSVKEDGLFSAGPAAKFYQDLLDESMTKAMAEGGHLGIGRMAEQQLRRDGFLPPELTPAVPGKGIGLPGR